MPRGPGTYGSKRGRPPKKKSKVMGYKAGGMKKSPPRTLDEKIKFFRKQKGRSLRMLLEPTIPGEPLLEPRQYDGIIKELEDLKLLEKKKKPVKKPVKKTKKK